MLELTFQKSGEEDEYIWEHRRGVRYSKETKKREKKIDWEWKNKRKRESGQKDRRGKEEGGCRGSHLQLTKTSRMKTRRVEKGGTDFDWSRSGGTTPALLSPCFPLAPPSLKNTGEEMLAEPSLSPPQSVFLSLLISFSLISPFSSLPTTIFIPPPPPHAWHY